MDGAESGPRDAPLVEGLTREYLLHHRVCPLGLAPDGSLRIAVEAAFRPGAVDELEIVCDRPAVLEVVEDGEVDRLVERFANRAERAVELARGDELDREPLTDVRDLANQAPVIRYVNLLLRDAFDASASDLHLESTAHGLHVRSRIDGVLVPALEPPAHLQHAVLSRIKLLADLDIAERRRPQDGRIRVRVDDREVDLRVATVPTIFGESVVLRLLDRGARPASLQALGMTAAVQSSVERLARLAHGMLLVTGPTGSGKTTTLYAALSLRASGAEKVVTVEEPVEYQLAGVTQVPVHRQAGVSFATALRSLLRQDPDVVMIGEMRDPETAEIAVQAAMTGHLVFSTLHTNDALSAVPRLVDLGVPPFLLAATLEGVLAQRLVRRVCVACSEPYQPHPEAVRRVAGDEPMPPDQEFVRGSGCPACRGTGFRGRTGLFELVAFSDALRRAVGSGATPEELAELAGGGRRTLAADGWSKAVAGLTTVEEVNRVLSA